MVASASTRFCRCQQALQTFTWTFLAVLCKRWRPTLFTVFSLLATASKSCSDAGRVASLHCSPKTHCAKAVRINDCPSSSTQHTSQSKLSPVPSENEPASSPAPCLYSVLIELPSDFVRSLHMQVAAAVHLLGAAALVHHGRDRVEGESAVMTAGQPLRLLCT